jgi:putative Holliday junction resolvase
MKYLGIDYGTRKIGLALGESVSRTAMPLEVFVGGDDAVERICALAQQEHIDAFVVGIPVPFHTGQPRTQFDRAQRFADALENMSRLPVYKIDEVFTSREAQRIQDEYGSRVPEDALAAMMLVQEYFDNHLSSS